MKQIVEKINYNAPVTLSFTFVALVVLLIDSLSGSSRLAVTWFALRPTFDVNNLFRMVTYVFAHADFNHFFGNFSIILLIGPLIEEKYGSRKLLFMMLATALITAIIHIIFFNTWVIGASGIVFMLILLTPFTNMKTGKIPLTFILIAFIYIGREIFLGLSVVNNVSRFAHIIGGIIGAVIGYFVQNKEN